MNQPNNSVYDQLEFQRKNPHLYTTMTQYVDPIGNIITLDSVTVRVRETLDKLHGYHEQIFGDKYCGGVCAHATYHKSVCESIKVLETDYERAASGFVEHYKIMRNRLDETHRV